MIGALWLLRSSASLNTLTQLFYLFDIALWFQKTVELFVGPFRVVKLYMAVPEEQLQNWFLCSQFKVIIEFAINNLK